LNKRRFSLPLSNGKLGAAAKRTEVAQTLEKGNKIFNFEVFPAVKRPQGYLTNNEAIFNVFKAGLRLYLNLLTSKIFYI